MPTFVKLANLFGSRRFERNLPLLLQGKHWQIFIPVIGVYLAGNIIGIFPMPFPSRPGSIIAKESLAFGLLIGLSSLGLYFWFWTMGSFFTSILKPELRPRLSLFQVALIYLSLIHI